MPASFRAMSEFGLLASAPEPFDPMERAFHTLGPRAIDRDLVSPP